MTWTKFGAEFFDQCADAGLTDAAVRTHCEAIGWLYHINRPNVRDLSIPPRALRRFANSEDYEAGVAQLVRVEFWRDEGEQYVLVHHADVVRSSLAAQRAKLDRDRRAQQNRRARPKVKPSESVSADVSDDVSGDADSQTGSTLTHSLSESRSKDLTDVGGKSSQLDMKNTDDWPEPARPGAGVPRGVASLRASRCEICLDPIDSAAGPIHPSCEDELEHEPTS